MSKLLLLLFLFSSIAFFSTSVSDEFTDFVYAGCSQPKYTLGSPYQFNVESLLASLANAASFSSYANFTSSVAGASSPAYGLLQCRGDLPFSDCNSCVRSALSQLSALCPSAAGAAIQLRGCFLRYGNDSFLGKPDTGLLYKKCGPAAGGYNSDLLGMRDAALADLTSGAPGGNYRVGAAGYVQAMAQCVGDLSVKQCDDCVAAAVAQLRAVCGLAVAGDAYLGKCYARYWSNGVYTSDTDHGDEAGKTLAIIIGLMAGVALIIVFLSFLRRAGNDEKAISASVQKQTRGTPQSPELKSPRNVVAGFADDGFPYADVMETIMKGLLVPTYMSNQTKAEKRGLGTPRAHLIASVSICVIVELVALSV